MTAADLPGTREALARELRTHPGAPALLEALQECLEEFDASTSPLDVQSQHFDGEWKEAAALTRKLMGMLQPETLPAPPDNGTGYPEATDSVGHDVAVCDCGACENVRGAEASHKSAPAEPGREAWASAIDSAGSVLRLILETEALIEHDGECFVVSVAREGEPSLVYSGKLSDIIADMAGDVGLEGPGDAP